MAAASRFSKTAKYMLNFSRMPPVVSLLDLLRFPLSFFDSICALYIIFFPGFLDIPRGAKRRTVLVSIYWLGTYLTYLWIDFRWF